MYAYLTMLVAMSLLCNAASLHIGHQSEPVKNEEHVTMIRGVPVYNLNTQQKNGGRYIITFKSGAGGNKDACENDPHCIHFESNGAVNFEVVELKDASELDGILANLDGAESVEPDWEVYAQDADQDFSRYLLDETAFEGAATWGLTAINKDTAVGDGGHGVHAYVYDTGVRVTHAQFEGRGIPTLDAVTGQLIKCNCMNTSCAADRHGHGTHCAGTIAGHDWGVAPNARIHAVKVLSDSGSGYTSWQVMCHNWIVANAHPPSVVSMSLGGSGNSLTSKNAIDAVVASGVTVVVAAGNSNADACNYSPAYIPSAITVGSTTSTNAMSYFSNYGTCLDIWAPGSSVLSCGISDDWATSTKSGTSMACPHVAGGVALLQDLLNGISPANVITQLQAGGVTGLITGIPASPASPDYFLQVDTLTVPR